MAATVQTSTDVFRTTEPATLAATAIPFLSSSFRQFRTSASNSSFFGAADNVAIDLLMVLPRFASRAASFALYTVPEQMGNFGMGFGLGQDGKLLNASSKGAIASKMTDIPRASGWQAGSMNSASATFQSVKGFGGVFSYVTSPWAILCLFMAIALNRTQIYASLRRPLSLSWPVRLTLRLIPILLFVAQITRLLQAIRCQTSPDYAVLRYNNATELYPSDFNLDGGALHTLSSALLFYQSDRDSCMSLGMVPASGRGKDDATMLNGSLSLLWPLFQTLCLSQFIETLSCAVQARPVQTEMGMTIFEQSLAFAESEAMASNKVGWGPFGFPSFGSIEQAVQSAKSDSLSKATVLAKLNTPPEVLFIALISSLNHLSSHILGVLGWQSRYRLLNSGVWGLCFLGAFIWSIAVGSEGDLESGLLRFPTVCIVGFIPHLLILMGITICALIYGIALVLSTLCPPQGYQQVAGMTLRQRLAFAHGNLQANVQLSTLRISMHEEFYTTLLKVGFVALTAASEAVYLNEGRAVEVQRWTWLDEDRMRELAKERRSGSERPWIPPALLLDRADSVANGVGLIEENTKDVHGWASPYQRERQTQRVASKKDRTQSPAKHHVTKPDGTGRWVLAWEFLRGIFWLLVSWNAAAILRVLATMGIPWRPRWLTKMDNLPKERLRQRKLVPHIDSGSRVFHVTRLDGEVAVWDENVDVETEMRNQMQSTSSGADMESKVDKALYTWWLRGGWWGSEDSSGDWEPPQQEDDTTSVVSFSTAAESEWEDYEEESVAAGARTPTQSEPWPSMHSEQESEIENDFDLSALDANHLAALLNPTSLEERREARILARHLTSTKPLTRSAFAKDEARILLSPSARRQAGLAPVAVPQNRPLTKDEEGVLLEQILLSSRFADGAQAAPSWEAGAPGLGASGPQCVVCQSSPRTILIWPCRCLALCEDCRVSLAMNNFATCVCCRRDVVAFSRIYVP